MGVMYNYKMEKRNLIFGILVLLVIATSFFLETNVSAQTSTVCAVQSNEGICQDVDPSQVTPGSETYTTSCSQGPGQCKRGTCVDTNLGTCTESSFAACNPAAGGEFYDTSPANTPVCNTGCCIVGTSGSVTTRAHCDELGLAYPGARDFIESVTNDLACTVLAAPILEGACVYSTATAKTCEFLTQENCLDRKQTNPDAAFYATWLCTNENLASEGVNCRKTELTMCVTGKDAVYFRDSCGNPANIYDSTVRNDANREKVYWNYVVGTNDIPFPAIATPGSTTNGYCDHPSSTCALYNSAIDTDGAPVLGDYICRDLRCKSGDFVPEFQAKYGRTPVNGETWCARTDIGNFDGMVFGSNAGLIDESKVPVLSENGTPILDATGATILTEAPATLFSSIVKNQSLPGARDFVLGCHNGRVTVEMCADYRNEICSQDQNTNGIYQSQCILNRWTGCYTQKTQQDCLNPEIGGDCQWVRGISILRDDDGNRPVWDPETDSLIPRTEDNKRLLMGASCVPKYSPGFDVSTTNSEAAQIAAVQTCMIADTNCIVQFERGSLASLFDDERAWHVSGPLLNPRSNITCLDDDGTIVPGWEKNFTNLCYSLGDCGISANYINTPGYNSASDLFEVIGNLSGGGETTAPEYHL